MTDRIRDYFENGYCQRWGLGPPSQATELETSGLWNMLNLSPRSSVLDVGCGHGPHSVALQRRGAAMTGVDFSITLLRRAQSISEHCGLEIRWVQADMRRLPFRSSRFDAAILFDAFGFFESEHENNIVVAEIAAALAPLGRVAIKAANAEPIIAALRSTDREEPDGAVVELSRALISNPARLIEKIKITGRQGSRDYERRQRLYRADEPCRAMGRAGLNVAALYSDALGNSFDSIASRHMLIIGELRP
jgi:SAM-dependent methyltransferase